MSVVLPSEPGAGAPDAGALADAARACPSVVDVTGGALDEVATHLPGRRVPGVRITDDAVEIHVVASMAAESLPTVGEEVRARLRPLAAGRRVDVYIDDVAQPELAP